MKSQDEPELLVDFCSYDAIKYACQNWHYSKTTPAGKIVKIGVWEDKKFIGCVLFSRGGTLQIGMPYNLNQDQVCELTRIALTNHKHPVTEIISKAIKCLKLNSPNLKLIVSYADSNQNHLGIIYQASNWIYEGHREVTPPSIIINGEKIHARSVNAKYGTASLKWLKENVDPNAKYAKDKGRHKYLYPLNKMLRKKLMKLSKPYPKKK
jgi:hypothetical protein